MMLSPNDDSAWTEVPPSAAGMNAVRLKHATDWTTFGLPRSAWGERVVINGKAAFIFNWRRMREAVCPSATTSTTAREVAVFYEMLRRGGRHGSVQLLSEATILAARQPSSDGEVDQFIKAPMQRRIAGRPVGR